MGFQNVMFLPPELVFTPHFLKDVLKCGLLQQVFFCVSLVSLRSQVYCKDELYLATLSFGDITRFNTVVSVYMNDAL